MRTQHHRPVIPESYSDLRGEKALAHEATSVSKESRRTTPHGSAGTVNT